MRLTSPHALTFFVWVCMDNNEVVNMRLGALGWTGGCQLAVDFYKCDSYMADWGIYIHEICCETCRGLGKIVFFQDVKTLPFQLGIIYFATIVFYKRIQMCQIFFDTNL